METRLVAGCIESGDGGGEGFDLAWGIRALVERNGGNIEIRLVIDVLLAIKITADEGGERGDFDVITEVLRTLRVVAD
jgi:hypothetical protein